MAFDYNGPAEVFAGRSQRGPRPMRYQRFDTGAEALRFAIEILPRANLLGAILESNERRYWHAEIRKLYDAPGYLLPRQEPKEAPEPVAKVEPVVKAEPKVKLEPKPKPEPKKKKEKALATAE